MIKASRRSGQKSATRARPASRVIRKTPLNRLLDMTYGWYEFVQQEGRVVDEVVPVNELFALYQAAGNLPDETEVGQDASDAAVHLFVTEQIIPILLRYRS